MRQRGYRHMNALTREHGYAHVCICIYVYTYTHPAVLVNALDDTAAPNLLAELDFHSWHDTSL